MEPIWKKHWPQGLDERSIRLPEEPLTAVLARQAKRVPDRTAIHFYGRAVTFAELDASVGRFAGFLQARGIDAELQFTTSSMEQLTALINGSCDIGLTAFDNIVASQEGQGEAAIERQPDLFAFMGGDNGFLRLVVQPEIRTYADLKGKTLSVDALTTGFAFVFDADEIRHTRP